LKGPAIAIASFGGGGAIIALAGTMEATKLVTAGLLARHWRWTGGLLRVVPSGSAPRLQTAQS
jgi:hypothetical protein